MVGYTAGDKQLSHANHLIAGAISGAITRGLTQPFEVLKIRFQLQVEPISRNSQTSKYRSNIQSLRTIIKEERFSALWKGHVGAQALTTVYMAAEFASFEALTKVLATRYSENNRKSIHFISGGGAGTIATVVSYPLDVVRTRFIAQGEKFYSSLLHACRMIYIKEGIRGLYRGLTASLMHSSPQAALHFGCYESYKQALQPLLRRYATDNEDMLKAVCGAGAGFTSKLITYPLDTAKRRLQVVGFGDARHMFGETRNYRNLSNYVVTSFKEEGIRGFYKGVSWALFKSSISTSMYFYFYEKICEGMRNHHDSE